MIVRKISAVALLLGTASIATAQQSGSSPPMSPERMARMAPVPPVIPAPADPDAIPLYGARTPGTATSENWSKQGDNVIVRNVTRPTLTPVLPDPARATGAAVIIAPGGGFVALSTETEGYQEAHMLAERGIAAFVLKYRLVATPPDGNAARLFSVKRLMAGLSDPSSGGEALRNPESTEDGLAAIALVRSNAQKWNIDPARVGIMGFSAGAMTSLATALASDPAARPAFVGFVYGPQIAVPVPAGAPPIFDAIAFDDPVFPSMGFPLAAAWRKAGGHFELHAYERGGHGFGMGRSGTTTTLMMEEFVAWLSMHGFLARSAGKG